MKLIITGGHHSSAMPLIELIRNTHPDIELFWIGHKRSLKGDESDTLEYREITSLGIPFYDLQAGKFYRTFDISRLLKIPLGFFQALRILMEIKPDLIMSFGGYLAVPVVLAGYILNIPSVTHEQTVVAGYANRVISKFAKRVLVSWESSLKFFPSGKATFSGLPLRKAIFEVRSSSFSSGNTLPFLLVLGGKTGSHILNETVMGSLEDLLSRYNVIHQCGDNTVYNDFLHLSEKYANLNKTGLGQYFLRKFIFENEIGEAYKAASIVLARSGAHTINEIMALNKKAVLVPIPWVSHNEQMENAKVVKDVGLGIIIEEEKLNHDTLLSGLREAEQLPLPSHQATQRTGNPEQIMLSTLLSTLSSTKK